MTGQATVATAAPPLPARENAPYPVGVAAITDVPRP